MPKKIFYNKGIEKGYKVYNWRCSKSKHAVSLPEGKRWETSFYLVTNFFVLLLNIISTRSLRMRMCGLEALCGHIKCIVVDGYLFNWIQ